MSEWSAKYLKEINALVATVEELREKSKSRRLRIRCDESENRLQQRIEEIKATAENLPNIFAEMATAGEEHNSLNVVSEELWYLAEELRGIIAEETAILKAPLKVDGFVVEPLQDGQVLIRLLSQDHDYEFTAGAFVLSGKCFTALAQVDIDGRVVKTELSNFHEQFIRDLIAPSEKGVEEKPQTARLTVNKELSTPPNHALPDDVIDANAIDPKKRTRKVYLDQSGCDPMVRRLIVEVPAEWTDEEIERITGCDLFCCFGDINDDWESTWEHTIPDDETELIGPAPDDAVPHVTFDGPPLPPTEDRNGCR